jgi:hypothetical protein
MLDAQGFDVIDPFSSAERDNTAQDIRAFYTASYEGRQQIMRAMKALHRWTREAAEAYESAGGDNRARDGRVNRKRGSASNED